MMLPVRPKVRLVMKPLVAGGFRWCSPERHGVIIGVMKNQIDWVPLEQGVLCPSQGRMLALMQVCGGS